MSRACDGIDDVFNFGLVDLPAGWTFGAVVKFDAGVGWQSMFSSDNSSNASKIATGRQGIAGTFSTFTGGGANTQQGPAVSSADGWVALFAGRSAGLAQTVRFMKYPIGGSPAFSNSSGGQDNQTSQAGGKTVFGEIDGSDFAKLKWAVGAIWTSKLSDADMQSCIDTFTLANWLSKSPEALWDERDAFNSDLTGNGHNRTLLTGTTDDADDPTGWASWAASGTTLSPASLTHTRAQGTPVVSPQLRPASLTRTRALGSPTATATGSAAPVGLTHTRALGIPVVNPQLRPAGLTHTRTLGSPGIPGSGGTPGALPLYDPNFPQTFVATNY